eukprot:scaffold4424_cov113-Isochrysis_galbana.AAC.11
MEGDCTSILGGSLLRRGRWGLIQLGEWASLRALPLKVVRVLLRALAYDGEVLAKCLLHLIFPT